MNESKRKLDKLTDDMLDAFSGGYILDLGEDYYDPNGRWCLVDDKTGHPIHFTYSRSELEDIVRKYADRSFYSPDVITTDDYNRMYGEGFW